MAKLTTMKRWLVGFISGASMVQGVVLSFDSSDFTTDPQFSNVTTFDFTADIDGGLRTGVFADPALSTIGYNVSGSLTVGTPSGFPAFSFQLSHLTAPPPAGPTVISGTRFYELNPDALFGDRLSFVVSADADLSDGLQVSELEGSGSDVVFRFNGREVDSGRYHPAFIELRADGTGLLQNANNMGGINPATNREVDVAFGEEYITNLIFDPASLTIAVPEPASSSLALLASGLFAFRRRRS